jgi:hypothetical protein
VPAADHVLTARLALCVLVACGAPQAGGPPACPPGATVNVDADAAALSSCTELAELAIGPSFTLRTLGGLAGIARVSRGLDVSDNIELGGLFLPGLRSVGGDVIIENNRQIETASLHHLAEVSGDLVVRGNRALLRLDLGALRRVSGRLVIADQPLLEAVALDRLESAGELVIEECPAWPAEEIDRLRRALAPRSAP